MSGEFLGPQPDGLDEAIIQFRAAGGTPDQLTVFARIVAAGRLRHVDLDYLARTMHVGARGEDNTPNAP
jgi:hypothetical protein